MKNFRSGCKNLDAQEKLGRPKTVEKLKATVTLKSEFPRLMVDLYTSNNFVSFKFKDNEKN